MDKRIGVKVLFFSFLKLILPSNQSTKVIKACLALSNGSSEKKRVPCILGKFFSSDNHPYLLEAYMKKPDVTSGF